MCWNTNNSSHAAANLASKEQAGTETNLLTQFTYLALKSFMKRKVGPGRVEFGIYSAGCYSILEERQAVYLKSKPDGVLDRPRYRLHLSSGW